MAAHILEIIYLPPATKLGQGYIFTGVCDSVHGGGGESASVHAGIPPPLDQAPPGSMHPPGQGTPPRTGSPSPWNKHPLDQAPPSTEHAGRYGQRMGSMHPTGKGSGKGGEKHEIYTATFSGHLFMTYFTGPRGRGHGPSAPLDLLLPPPAPLRDHTPTPGTTKVHCTHPNGRLLVIFQVKTISHLTSFRISSEAIN